MREGFFLGEGGVEGLEGLGGHASGFLFNFSKVTENAIITIKLLSMQNFPRTLQEHWLVNNLAQ